MEIAHGQPQTATAHLQLTNWLDWSDLVNSWFWVPWDSWPYCTVSQLWESADYSDMTASWSGMALVSGHSWFQILQDLWPCFTVSWLWESWNHCPDLASACPHYIAFAWKTLWALRLLFCVSCLEMCLLRCCIAMTVYIRSTILTFCHNVTVCIILFCSGNIFLLWKQQFLF
jgi:hypothetical protein